MAKRNSHKNVENTGFTANSSFEGSRLTAKDGTVRVRKTGMPFWELISIYHTLLRMKRSKFFLLILGFYSAINLIFAIIYSIIGVRHLAGTEQDLTPIRRFLEAFFFSSQTLTTVGYGHIAPEGLAANTVASIESLLGILVFALVTGIFYGRFSRPRAYVLFSDNVLIAPFRGGKALMFRIATYKNNHLTEVEVVLTAALHILEGDKRVTRFYSLPLDISKVNSLALSWTIVHPITEDSPLYGYSAADLIGNRLEILVFVKGFDDHFSNTVQQRSSYIHSELVWGAKFLPMYDRSEGGSYTLLELGKINAHEYILLPEDESPADPLVEVVAANA